METETYIKMIQILKAELVPALGCTEPIAIAYGAAAARKALGCVPERIVAECSGNIIKNAKSVVVPMTKDMKGIEAAAVVGMLGGDPEKELEVLTTVTEKHLSEAKELIGRGICEVKLLDTTEKLHIILTMEAHDNRVTLELMKTHTGICRIEKNGQMIYQADTSGHEEEETDYSVLNVDSILEFADKVNLDDVRTILNRQIEYNTRIAAEGLSHQYGINMGASLMEVYGDDVKTRARAMPAAGSDARMNGCELPVVINSGSGNQGMTVSLPVLEYGKALNADEESILRALCISNLIAVYQKSSIGRLSAYCGAVSAAAGAGAGITYLYGGREEEISKTLVNTLANVSGIVCDGAKSSCAAKIASSVEAAIMASEMARKGRYFEAGDGIVKDTVQKTVDGVVKLAREGMRETDEVILGIMLS